MGITVSGISSGLDVDSIVSQLMTLEQAPLTALATKEAVAQAKISALGSLKSAIASLQTAASAFIPGTGITAAEKFSTYRASVTDTAIATVTASTGAVAGTYSLEVTQLAKAHQIATLTGTSSPFTSEGKLAAGGTLTIALGTTTDPDATKTTSIDIADGATVEEIRNAINLANVGVSATVVNGTNGKQLLLTGSTSGSNQFMTLSGVPGLSYNSSDVNDGTSEFSQMQPAQGAAFTLNGIAVEADTNTVTTAIDGLTINLKEESASGVSTTITVTRDTSSLTSAVNAFVKTYNDFNTTASSLGSYNATTEVAGTLNGDSTLRSAQSMLRSLIGKIPSGLTGSTYQLLSNIGVSIQKDGSLSVDATKLSNAISNDFTNVANLVSAYGSAFKTATESLVGSSGIIAARTDGLNASIKSYEKRYEAVSYRLERIEARYRNQFSALDTLLASMNQTSEYLTQQLANLPKINNDN